MTISSAATSVGVQSWAVVVANQRGVADQRAQPLRRDAVELDERGGTSSTLRRSSWTRLVDRGLAATGLTPVARAAAVIDVEGVPGRHRGERDVRCPGLI